LEAQRHDATPPGHLTLHTSSATCEHWIASTVPGMLTTLMQTDVLFDVEPFEHVAPARMQVPVEASTPHHVQPI
jgi:hypothetical protein